MEHPAHEAGTLHGMALSHSESVDPGILVTSPESFERHFAVNARAGWQLMAAFARQAAPGGGAMIALTSDHTSFNLPYGASKGALVRIAIAAARALGGQGISACRLGLGFHQRGLHARPASQNRVREMVASVLRSSPSASSPSTSRSRVSMRAITWRPSLIAPRPRSVRKMRFARPSSGSGRRST